MKKTIICIVTLFSLVIFSCSKDDMKKDNENNSADITKLMADMNLTETNAVAKPIKFNSVEDARAYIQKLKNSTHKGFSKKIKFGSSDNDNLMLKNSGLEQHYTIHFASYKPSKLKSDEPEESGYTTSTDAGLFSSFNCNFNTDSNGNIDKNSVTTYVTGVAVGWGWDQLGGTQKDADSFVITGTVTWGISIGSTVIGYVDKWTITLDLDMTKREATWTFDY
jgi:hypothetical protein